MARFLSVARLRDITCELRHQAQINRYAEENMRDRIPYAVFVDLFERCNLAMWPWQIVGYLAALLVLVLVLTQWRHSRRLVYAILAPFWVRNRGPQDVGMLQQQN